MECMEGTNHREAGITTINEGTNYIEMSVKTETFARRKIMFVTRINKILSLLQNHFHRLLQCFPHLLQIRFIENDITD